MLVGKSWKTDAVLSLSSIAMAFRLVIFVYMFTCYMFTFIDGHIEKCLERHSVSTVESRYNRPTSNVNPPITETILESLEMSFFSKMASTARSYSSFYSSLSRKKNVRHNLLLSLVAYTQLYKSLCWTVAPSITLLKFRQSYLNCITAPAYPYATDTLA